MPTESLEPAEVLTTIDETVARLSGLMSPIGEEEINSVPYENSWTAGELLSHITKSLSGIAEAMTIPGKPAKRNPGEKVADFKKTFLDFSIQMTSPDFIIPDRKNYDKISALDELIMAAERLKENTNKAAMADVVENLPMGEVTKLELLHFALYHTQRHLHQMHKICDALKALKRN